MHASQLINQNRSPPQRAITDINKEVKKLLKEHPALIVSAFYVAASVIGMFYSWAYLGRFGINVFNYAQISDFLLASLKEPFTWGLVIIAVVLVHIDNASSRRVGRKTTAKWLAWYGSPKYRFIKNFVAFILVVLFLYSFAFALARDTRDGDGMFVDVMFADSGAATTALLLGTTGQFVFLYDEDTERVDIHPIENIHSISFRIPAEN
jgi:hypothetical protein